MITQQITKSIHIIKMMLTAAKNADIDSYIARQAIHLKPEVLNHPDARISMDVEIALWDFLVSRTGDNVILVFLGYSR